MVETVPNILTRIVARKQEEVARLRPAFEELEAKADRITGQRRDFAGALTRRRPSIIAEIKKASPSKGILSERFDPAALARDYETGGAAALSVLTDQDFFQGSLAHLAAARSNARLPVLRKDFTIDESQIIEAAAHGADAILLIVAILDARRIRDLRELARTLQMASLVEIHDAAELAIALDGGAEILGVNNRDLRTFHVTLETSLRLVEKIPSHLIKVSESGIHTAADVKRLAAAGFDAFLVGERLMKSGRPAEALRELRGEP